MDHFVGKVPGHAGLEMLPACVVQVYMWEKGGLPLWCWSFACCGLSVIWCMEASWWQFIDDLVLLVHNPSPTQDKPFPSRGWRK